jgi:hypothetical protein
MKTISLMGLFWNVNIEHELPQITQASRCGHYHPDPQGRKLRGALWTAP